ncbi:hypothetical protein SUGI_1005080 [Cryptomeria japonica]|nr:hypothetical protein SUGI_1005080 [Cryptomeria japonica]
MDCGHTEKRDNIRVKPETVEPKNIAVKPAPKDDEVVRERKVLNKHMKSLERDECDCEGGRCRTHQEDKGGM